MSRVNAVPTVHLDDYTDGATDRREGFIRTLGEGFLEYGFLIVDGHGVDMEVVARSYDLCRELFALPDEVKRKYAGIEGGARGYTPFGVEHARDHDAPDLKEFWQVGQELPQGHPYRGQYHDNVWPEELGGFRDAALALFRGLERCTRVLLEALAERLEVPRETFADMVVDGNHVLRFIHYPPIGEKAAPDAMRSAPHPLRQARSCSKPMSIAPSGE